MYFVLLSENNLCCTYWGLLRALGGWGKHIQICLCLSTIHLLVYRYSPSKAQSLGLPLNADTRAPRSPWRYGAKGFVSCPLWSFWNGEAKLNSFNGWADSKSTRRFIWWIVEMRNLAQWTIFLRAARHRWCVLSSLSNKIFWSDSVGVVFGTPWHHLH